MLCVSGASVFSGGTEVNEDTMIDRATGLEWQRGSLSGDQPWLDGLNGCEALALAGFDDWRMPSAKEMLTLVRDDQSPNPDLLGFPGETYWTSTPDFTPDKARTIELPSGTMSGDMTQFPLVVRCVRDATE